MPVFFEDAVKRDIATSNFSKCYLLYGDDLYLKKHYSDRISEKAYDGDPLFNLQKFELDANLQDVYDAVNQFPMMADSKCVLLIDYDFEHCSKSDLEMLCDLIMGIDEGCVFILRFDAIEFNTKNSVKAKKIMSAVEKCGGKPVCLNHRSHNSLAKMLITGAAKRGCVLDSRDAHYLIETCGDDLSLLKNELDKLCGYVKSGKINREVINRVAVKSAESSIYDYVQSIFDGNISDALKMLDDLFFMRVEPMIILYTASASYVDIYRVLTAKRADINIDTIATDFAYKNRAFVLEKAASNLKKFDKNKLLLSFNELLLADQHLKNFGYNSRTVLEELTVKLVYILVKGESVD